jgi:hypothetical protein
MAVRQESVLPPEGVELVNQFWRDLQKAYRVVPDVGQIFKMWRQERYGAFHGPLIDKKRRELLTVHQDCVQGEGTARNSCSWLAD